MASRIGRTLSPCGLSTLSEPWWKSRCHSPLTYSLSKLRTSRPQVLPGALLPLTLLARPPSALPEQAPGQP